MDWIQNSALGKKTNGERKGLFLFHNIDSGRNFFYTSREGGRFISFHSLSCSPIYVCV